MAILITRGSRYKDTLIHRVDGFPQWGLWEASADLRNAPYTTHQIRENEIGRLDLLAYEYYADPNLWWIIAHANDMIDVFADMQIGQFIRIPTNEAAEAFVQRGRSV